MKLFLIGIYLLTFTFVQIERKKRTYVEEVIETSIRSVAEQAFVYWDDRPYFDEKVLKTSYEKYWEKNLPSDLDYRYTLITLNEDNQICKNKCTGFHLTFIYIYFFQEKKEEMFIQIKEIEPSLSG